MKQSTFEQLHWEPTLTVGFLPDSRNKKKKLWYVDCVKEDVQHIPGYNCILADNISSEEDAKWIAEAILMRVRMERIAEPFHQKRIEEKEHLVSPYQTGVTNGLIAAIALTKGEKPVILTRKDVADAQPKVIIPNGGV